MDMPRTKGRLPLLWFLTGTIGDALMALALCNELAEMNSGLTSTLLVRKNAQLVKDLAKFVPFMQVEVVSFSPWPLLRLIIASMHPWQLMSAWKNEGGLRGKLRNVFLLNPHTQIVRFDIHQPASARDMVAPYDMSKLVIDNFRVMAQTVGLSTRPVGSPTSMPIAAVLPSSFNVKSNSYIVVHPFGSNDLKSLPPERCRSILKALGDANPQLSFVVTGGKQDGAAIEKIIEGLPRTQAAIGLPILEVAGLIQHAVLYIGVDTGVTHLAAMMGKRVLALEHPTMPRWFPTYNPKTVMLKSEPDAREGVWGISDARVLAEVSAMLV